MADDSKLEQAADTLKNAAQLLKQAADETQGQEKNMQIELLSEEAWDVYMRVKVAAEREPPAPSAG